MKYEPSLDGMRAVAVTCVVVYHAHQSLLPGGWAGVDMFFVLSGYLISTILLREAARSNSINFGRFYARRALRLMPALVCLLAVLLPVCLLSKAHEAEDLDDMAMAATYLMNWNRAFDWFPGGGGFLGHTWSLAMEEQFYFVWPFVLIYLMARRKAAPFLILGLIVVIVSWRIHLVHSGASVGRTYDGFDVHSDSLLIGAAVAFLPLGPGIRAIARALVVLPIAVLAAILLSFHLDSARTQAFGFTLVGLCAAWIMIAAMQEGMLKTLLSMKFLVYTGRISYGWYLWFYPLFLLGADVMPNRYGNILVVVLSYFAAVISYEVVERPFLRLRDRYRVA